MCTPTNKADTHETLARRIEVLENHVQDLKDTINGVDNYVANLYVIVSYLERRHEWWIRNIRQQMSEAGASMARPMPADTRDMEHLDDREAK